MVEQLFPGKVTVTRLDKSMVEIAVEVSAEGLERFREEGLRHFQHRLDVSGFRKGHVPEKTILDLVGEPAVLEEAASMAVRELLPRIFAEHRLDAIGRPEVTVTKLARGDLFSFTVKTAVVPDFALPDYRAIAQKALADQKPIKVEEKEVAEALLQIRKALAAKPGTEGQPDEAADPELPALTTELVQTIGDFKSVEDFTARLREQIHREKELRANEKVRAEVAEALVQATTIVVPDILIEGELQRMHSRLIDDLTRSGSTSEQYLTQTQKTEKELFAEWRPQAEKAASLQLIFNKLALVEGLAPATADIDHHANRILGQVKGADPEAVRIYAATVLQNEAVFQFLHSL